MTRVDLPGAHGRLDALSEQLARAIDFLRS